MSAPAMSLNGQFALSDHMIASSSTVTKDVVVRASLQSRTLTVFNLKVLLQNHNHHGPPSNLNFHAMFTQRTHIQAMHSKRRPNKYHSARKCSIQVFSACNRRSVSQKLEQPIVTQNYVLHQPLSWMVSCLTVHSDHNHGISAPTWTQSHL